MNVCRVFLKTTANTSGPFALQPTSEMVVVFNKYLLLSDQDRVDTLEYFVVTPDPSVLPNVSCRGVNLFDWDTLQQGQLICLAKLPPVTIFPCLQPVYHHLDYSNLGYDVREDEAMETWKIFRDPMPDHLHQIVLQCFNQLAIPAIEAHRDPWSPLIVLD